jgi:hypothetical protein
MHPKLGEVIFRKSYGAGIVFRKILLDPLSQDSHSESYDFNTKWKLVVNAKMEVDV